MEARNLVAQVEGLPLTPAAPNSPEVPDSSQELASVLAEIAEIEARPGFEGPKIGRRLKLIRISASEVHGYESDEVFDDRVVGKISRACDARGWRICLTGRYWPGKDALMCTIAGDERAIIRWGSSRALAAARAYRDALKETCE